MFYSYMKDISQNTQFMHYIYACHICTSTKARIHYYYTRASCISTDKIYEVYMHMTDFVSTHIFALADRYRYLKLQF